MIDQNIINYNDNCLIKDFNFSIIKKIKGKNLSKTAFLVKRVKFQGS